MDTQNAGDEEVLQVLRTVYDPEIGINIVDLGLVYRASRTADEIDVAITTTAPTCPLGEMLSGEARDSLKAHFPDQPSIRVQLVFEPAWSPDRISEQGRRQLGSWPQ